MSDEPQESLITDEMQASIGKDSEITTLEIDKTSVRMFARSVGYTDPVYYDEEAAQAAGYRSLPAPPGYLGTPLYDPNKRSARPTQVALEPSRPLKRMLNGGTDIEYLADICAGDVLTSTSAVSSIEERLGRLGEMLITTTKTTYRNQHGEIVAIMTGTGIRY
tara:strand:+ start:61 stop:549 length:489 start_codon:yes stop_codon:yes gene_type:complete